MSILTLADNKEALAQIESEAEMIVTKSQEITVIIDAEGERRATEFLSQIKLRIKEIDAAKAKLVKPIKDHVKQLEAEFKRISEPLERADELVRAAMIAYRNSDAVKTAQAEAEKLQVQAMEAMRAGNTQAFQELAAAHEYMAAEAPKKVETQSGEARFRKTWRWEISDLEQLPAEYWIPDEKKIAAAVKSGMPVPGIKAWQEETPVII